MNSAQHILFGGPLAGRPVDVEVDPDIGTSILYQSLDPSQPPATPGASPRGWSRALAIAVVLLALFGLHSLWRIVLP